jgi:hypothetical protein
MILLPLPLSFVPSLNILYKHLMMPIDVNGVCERREEQKKKSKKDIFHCGVLDNLFWYQPDAF